VAIPGGVRSRSWAAGEPTEHFVGDVEQENEGPRYDLGSPRCDRRRSSKRDANSPPGVPPEFGRFYASRADVVLEMGICSRPAEEADCIESQRVGELLWPLAAL
jgi:hypothetical protein